MVDFGTGAASEYGCQATRLRRHLPLGVAGAAQLHPEAMRSPFIASGYDLQAVGRQASAQSLRGIIGLPIASLPRLLIEAVARRRHSLLQRAIQPLPFEVVERGLSLQGRQRTAGSRSLQPQSEQPEAEQQTQYRQNYGDSSFHDLDPFLFYCARWGYLSFVQIHRHSPALSATIPAGRFRL